MMISRNRVALLVAITLGLVALCSCAFARNTPAQELSSKGFVLIEFQPGNADVPEGAQVSDGSLYSAERGFGWDRDIRSQSRRRDAESAGVALVDRAVSQAEFAVDLPDGDYSLEITSLDTQFPGMLVPLVEGCPAAQPVQYGIGQKATVKVAAASKGGKLRVSFAGGRDGYSNSLISSIKITPAAADSAGWNSAKEIADGIRKDIMERAARNIAKRAAQRASYKPLNLTDSRSPHQEFDLTGKWLFMPSQDMRTPTAGADPSADDKSWHVLGVPQFWQPIEWWLYAPGEGASHNYLRKERERCDNFTFDYKSTRSGWYRHWISVPSSLRGKRFVLKFDAAASVAEVRWNGKPVGSHVGMFGPFECEVTPYVKPGAPNLLAVFVAAGKADENSSKQAAAVAVTVKVTHEMLNSLPHGCFKPSLGGLWQPVRLEVMGKDRISDVYFKPRLDGAAIETTVERRSGGRVELRHAIVDSRTGALLYRATSGKLVANGSGTHRDRTDIRGLKPRLWSPEHPNLYKLRTQLLCAGKVVDEVVTTVGFKTFEARGNRLYLNGKLYFMRGSNQPPHGLAPNDKALAQKFMGLMHDGNLMFTRFHVGAPPRVWMDAADERGVGASVGETWPWVLMGDTPIPDPKLLKVWKNEFLEIVRANRNHPSRLLWTISNESYFEGDTDSARRLQKYRIFSDVIKSVRSLDPATPIVFHSGHVTDPKQREELLKPNGIDDGDIDDEHCYYGWYWESPFHLDFKKIESDRGAGDRPLISQEASTGYPDNDTGHPTEKYTRDHIVPQSWVGKYAGYDASPDVFLESHAQITKEYAEKIRRERTYLSGWGLFATVNWFKDVYDAERITPYPVYWAVKKAYQPVLVSIDSAQRHFTAGQSFRSNAIVVNDDPDRPMLTNLSLRWRVYGACDDPGASGVVSVPDCAYDSKSRVPVAFEIPAKLPADRSGMTLALDLLQGDDVISSNDYPLICATPSYYTATGLGTLLVLEKSHETSDYLKGLGLDCRSQESIDWAGIDASTCVVVSPGVDSASLGAPDAFRDFVSKGGRALLLDAAISGKIPVNAAMLSAVPGFPADRMSKVSVDGNFVDVFQPELLSGMDPMDVRWWNGKSNTPVKVCKASYQLPEAPGVTRLAQHISPHGYVHKGNTEHLFSWPVIEVKTGKGRVIASTMILADDPLSKRFTLNLLSSLFKQ